MTNRRRQRDVDREWSRSRALSARIQESDDNADYDDDAKDDSKCEKCARVHTFARKPTAHVLLKKYVFCRQQRNQSEIDSGRSSPIVESDKINQNWSERESFDHTMSSFKALERTIADFQIILQFGNLFRNRRKKGESWMQSLLYKNIYNKKTLVGQNWNGRAYGGFYTWLVTCWIGKGVHRKHSRKV